MGKTSTEEKKAFGDLYDPPLISDSGAVFAQSAPQRGEARLPANAAVTLALGPPRNETARFRRGGPDSVPVTQPCAPHRAVGTERGSRGLSGCLLGGLVTVVSQERAPGQGPASSAPSFSIPGTSQRVVCPKVPLGATSRRCAHLRLHPVERSRLTSAGAACSVITRLPCGGACPSSHAESCSTCAGPTCPGPASQVRRRVETSRSELPFRFSRMFSESRRARGQQRQTDGRTPGFWVVGVTPGHPARGRAGLLRCQRKGRSEPTGACPGRSVHAAAEGVGVEAARDFRFLCLSAFSDVFAVST